MGASDVVKAIVSPVNKLIESVSGAIGKVYEPRHIRKMADAKKYEIDAVCQALRENSDIPIEYKKDGIKVDTQSYEELVKRAQKRLAFQEIQKQQNIECVADKAYELLEGEPACSSEPISSDWMTRFFNSVEDISEEYMQDLWAKILAGEIIKPKSFSLRTLECVKNLSKSEAEIFNKLTKIILYFGNDYFVLSEMVGIDKHIGYDDILLMNECGLINSGGSIIIDINLKNGIAVLNENSVTKVVLKGLRNISKTTLHIYPLTQIGRELFNLIKPDIDEENYKVIKKAIKEGADNLQVGFEKEF